MSSLKTCVVFKTEVKSTGNGQGDRKLGWGSGKAYSLSRAGMSRPGLSTGAFKKYKSLWQPDWGRQRKRSRSYIQVCMWHTALALSDQEEEERH